MHMIAGCWLINILATYLTIHTKVEVSTFNQGDNQGIPSFTGTKYKAVPSYSGVSDDIKRLPLIVVQYMQYIYHMYMST